MREIDVVCGVIRNELNQILITQRGDKLLNGKWEFPGGKVEHGETHEQSLKRELFEELSIDTNVREKIFQDTVTINDKVYSLHFYNVDFIKGKITLSNHISFYWVNIESLVEYDFLVGDLKMVELLVNQSTSKREFR